MLPKWFREIHGLDVEIPIYTLKGSPCSGDPWLRIAWDWLTEGSKLLKKEGADAAVINGVVPLRFSPKVAVNHGIDTLRVTRLYLHAARLLYRTYDATICVSNKLKEEVERKLRISCAVIPLPLKLETYRPAKPEDRDDLVVHIGTRPVKNPQISIEAIKSLRRPYASSERRGKGPSYRPPGRGAPRRRGGGRAVCRRHAVGSLIAVSSLPSAPSAGTLLAADIPKAYLVLTVAVSAAVLVSIAALHLAGVFKAGDYAALAKAVLKR